MQTNDREMETNFNKDTWKEGMIVWSIEFGNGVVEDTEYSDSFPIEVVFNDGLCFTYTKEGNRTREQINPTLFPYEIEVIKKPEFKTGDEVEVRNDLSDWAKRIYIGEYENKPLVIYEGDESFLKDGHPTLRICKWDQIRPIHKYTESEISHAIKILSEAGRIKEGRIII